jgi:hypothetical protein
MKPNFRILFWMGGGRDQTQDLYFKTLYKIQTPPIQPLSISFQKKVNYFKTLHILLEQQVILFALYFSALFKVDENV